MAAGGGGTGTSEVAVLVLSWTQAAPSLSGLSFPSVTQEGGSSSIKSLGQVLGQEEVGSGVFTG